MNQPQTITAHIEAEPADRMRFYEHKGYLLTALWQNEANILKLSEATGVDKEILIAAVESFEIDLPDLSSMFRESESVEMGAFLERAGLTPPDMLELQPIPGVNLDEMNAEKQAEMCERSTRCPLCNDNGVKQTLRDYPNRVFVSHQFHCGTTLDRTGHLMESKKCARIQARAKAS